MGAPATPAGRTRTAIECADRTKSPNLTGKTAADWERVRVFIPLCNNPQVYPVAYLRGWGGAPPPPPPPIRTMGPHMIVHNKCDGKKNHCDAVLLPHPHPPR